MMCPKKRRHIFALSRELRLTEEQRKIIQYSATGKESTTEMNDREADRLIRVLVEHKKKLKISKSGKATKMTPAESVKKGKQRNSLPSGENVIVLMTPEQAAKIRALSIHITGSFKEESMNRFTLRQFRKPFNRLTSNEAIRLIETQKKMLHRQINQKEYPDDI
jgi:hypothetical protein